MLDLDDIKRRLPHRYPFLLIDRVLEVEEGVSCKALKNVTANEQFFQGHFPDRPIMPGVLIVEAMAQACGIAAFAGETDPNEKLLLFVGIDKARFKRPVVPGDQLVFEVRIVSHKFNIWVFQAKATVDGDLAAQAEIRTATVPKRGKA